MSIKESYYYLFYKFYKLGDMSISLFPSDFVAAVLILQLEIFFLSSFIFYYRDFVNPNVEWEFMSIKSLLPFFLLVLIKFLAFIKDESWRTYFKKFDKFSQEKNDRGTVIIAIVVIIVIANFAVSASLG